MNARVEITAVQQGFYRAIIERPVLQAVVPIVNREGRWVASFNDTDLDITGIIHDTAALDATLVAFTAVQE
jgi:hypothetical protein